MSYGYFGTMTTKPGHRDEVVATLVSGADGLRAAGCSLYAVGVSETDPDLILVSELWETKEHHDKSLELPAARAAIQATMPLLTGEFTRHEMTVAGGLLP